jgi:ribosomal protein S18 acetylase RimI-like enzyme
MRTGAPSDIPSVIQLINLCFSDEIEQGLELPTMSQYQTIIDKPDYFLLVEEENSQIIAFSFIQGETLDHPSQIHMLAVHPNYQRNGIGRRMLESCLDLAREHNWQKIKLFARPWNIAMRKLVIEFGFIPEAYLRKEFLGKDLILFSYFR